MSPTLYYTFHTVFNRLYTIASTEKGLAYVSPDDGNLEPLETHFKNFKLQEDASMNAGSIKQIEEYIAGTRKEFDLDLDIQIGTPFQQSVWQTLLTIPFGQTQHYGAIADGINNPKAVRAVGGAIGRNPISIVIPCHRIIGKNGSLTGYSGGIDVKIKLLAIEGVQYSV